jgi:hypothetical protein
MPATPVAVVSRDLMRGVNCVDVPVIAVKIHSLARRMLLIEENLKTIQLDQVEDDAGHILVNSVLDLERLRIELLGHTPK